MTTDQINGEVHAFIIAQGAYPSPLQYNFCPKACCTSVNNIIVHGIPDKLSTVSSSTSICLLNVTGICPPALDASHLVVLRWCFFQVTLFSCRHRSDAMNYGVY